MEIPGPSAVLRIREFGNGTRSFSADLGVAATVRYESFPPRYLDATYIHIGSAPPDQPRLAHYLLGHNIGGNTARAVRRAVYFRIKRAGHDPRWREFLRDPWLDYDAVRQRLG